MKNIFYVLFLSLGFALPAQATTVELPTAEAFVCHDGVVQRGFTFERSWNVVRGVPDRHGLVTFTVRGRNRTSSRITVVVRGLWWTRDFSQVRAYGDGQYVATCASKDIFGNLRLDTDRCRLEVRLVPYGPHPDPMECDPGVMAYSLQGRLVVNDGR